jgi:hypothetical protein
VQRTIRNCDFCNAARTKLGIAMSQFKQVASHRAAIAQKKAAFKGGVSPGRKRPTGGGVSGVPSHHPLVMIWFGQNSKLIINKNVIATLIVAKLQ